MNLWPSDCPCLVQPLCIVWWKPGCHCLSLCMCPSHPTCGPTPFLECVHASIQEFMSTWLLSSGPALCILWCQVGCPCIGVGLCPSHLISDPTPCLECVHVSVHKFMSTFLSMSGPHPLHSLMSSWVALYGSVFVSQSSYFCCHTLFRMCNASGHIFMSTLLFMLAQPPMDSYIEGWVPLCFTVCVSQSPCLWSNTLFRMCTCISTWIYVYLTPHVWSTPYG